MNGLHLSAALAALTLAGCSMNDGAMNTPPADMEMSAVANLRTATNANVGTATAMAVAGGIRVTIEGMNMPPGPHAAHVHTVGRCDAPDFTTAGAHWNPTNAQHGMQNPAGPHAGDMPNLLIGTDGRGSLSVNLPAGTLAGMLEGDGSAMVIHAGPDDMMSDPAGNSGGRIACGVFQAMQ